MHAYFPALNSYPSLLGDMLADGINCLGFTWASSPACTELETIVMDWLGKMIGLPDEFLHTKPHSPGGGVIQTTASESTFVCLLAGRTEAIKRYQKMFPEMEDADINRYSNQSNSCEKLNCDFLNLLLKSSGSLLLGSSPFQCGKSRTHWPSQDQVHRKRRESEFTR